MKLKTLFSVSVILICLAATAQSSGKEYIKTLKKERLEKDKEFLDPAQSPMNEEGMHSFSGLNYFKPDIDFVIYAKLERKITPDTIKMKTTTERLPLYIVYGEASFRLGGKDHKLTVYRNVGLMTKPGFEDYLFIPFTDETSGKLSYGGGRYIDARIPKDDIIIIDFNRAYNPYCTYNKKYSCPVPPSQNHLSTEIRAGEKAFKH